MDARTQFSERVLAFERKVQANLDKVFCPVHLCFGHEMVAEAIHQNIRLEDWLFSYHRNHGHYLAKGGDEQALWDEIMGLETGINQGFSGSQEFSDPKINFHASAIVGGLVGVAAGTALALKLSGKSAIAVCCIGDAGAEQGVFWESLNFAALKQLPILYIIENNRQADGSPIVERQAREILYRCGAFGMEIVDDVTTGFNWARQSLPTVCEVSVTLECDHLNCADMK